MAKKFYVVWQGRKPGIYNDWNHCKQQVDQFAGAKYKSYSTLAEAELAFKNGRSHTVKKAGGEKKPAIATKGIKTYTSSEIDQMPVEVKIYTDGGCHPNPGKAGSGMAVYRHNTLESLWYGLYNPKGTNNTAELNALNQALILAQTEVELGHSLAIFCDSKYAIQCITQWAVSWQKKGWSKQGGEIKNLILIQEIFERYQRLKPSIHILHVNGHIGVEGNELADRMTMVAIEQQESQFKCYEAFQSIEQVLAMQAG